MKKILFSIVLLLTTISFIDAQKIARRCVGSSSEAKVEIVSSGDINITPCPNRIVSINGGGTGGGGGGNGQGLSGYTVSHTSALRTLDPNDVNFSISTLANVLGTTIQDLQTTGILNAQTPTLYELGDETTILTTGTKKTIRLPVNFTLIKAKASLTTASSAGNVIIDIKLNGSSIFGTNKLSIDAGENTTATAATAVSYSNNSLTDDGELTFVVTSSGANATGLKIWLIGRYTAL